MEDPSFQQLLKDTEKGLKSVGRLVVRTSGTEPVIRLMAESRDCQLLDKSLDHLENCLAQNKYI